MEMFKKVSATILTGICTFWILVFWAIIFWILGILLIVDWVYKIWNNRRIDWIVSITNQFSDFFRHPFGRH